MTTRAMISGTVEYLDVTVTSSIALGSQPVAISVDRGHTWMTAAWQGSGNTATATVLLGAANALPAANTKSPVWLKITSSPEVPIIEAGSLTVSSI